MTLRAGTERAAAVIAAAPAAAPPAAAIAVLLIFVRLAFFPRADDERLGREPELRRALAFLPPLRPAERRADVDDELELPPRRLEEPPRLFEPLLLDERFLLDEDRLLDELRDRPFFELDFFEDLPEEPLFDAAMLCLLLDVRCEGTVTGIRNHAACNVWCTRCTDTM